MGPVEVPAEGCRVLGDRHPVLAGAWVAAQLGWPVGRPAAVEQAGVGWGAVVGHSEVGGPGVGGLADFWRGPCSELGA